MSTLDILPTALDAARVAYPGPLSGRKLQPLLADTNPDEWRKYIFAMTTGSFPRNCYVQKSVRDAQFKLISNPRPGAENFIAGSYLDHKRLHFVISGVLPEERATVSPDIEAAYQVWERPPRYELCDLRQDPHEWTNLADDPKHGLTKRRLIAALDEFQRTTRDPFMDSENVESFVAEQLDYRDLRYRTQKDFQWDYLGRFAKWRSGR